MLSEPKDMYSEHLLSIKIKVRKDGKVIRSNSEGVTKSRLYSADS